MNIYGKKVILRAMEPEDCELVRDMFNDPEIEDLVVGWAFPLSRYAQMKWYENHYNDNTNFRFIIETQDDVAVGVATLMDLDWKNRRADHGLKIFSSNYRNKGIGYDTVMTLMKYAFDELGLHRLETSYFDQNIASKKLWAKCGWAIEGKKRDYVFKNGSFRDLTLVGILASDYYALLKKNHYWDED